MAKLGQRRGVGGKMVSQYVKTPSLFGAELHAPNDLYAHSPAGLRSPVYPGNGIMIGDSQRFQPPGFGQTRHFLRHILAVRSGGMDMQIGFHLVSSFFWRRRLYRRP